MESCQCFSFSFSGILNDMWVHTLCSSLFLICNYLNQASWILTLSCHHLKRRICLMILHSEPHFFHFHPPHSPLNSFLISFHPPRFPLFGFPPGGGLVCTQTYGGQTRDRLWSQANPPWLFAAKGVLKGLGIKIRETVTFSEVDVRCRYTLQTSEFNDNQNQIRCTP